MKKNYTDWKVYRLFWYLFNKHYRALCKARGFIWVIVFVVVAVGGWCFDIPKHPAMKGWSGETHSTHTIGPDEVVFDLYIPPTNVTSWAAAGNVEEEGTILMSYVMQCIDKDGYEVTTTNTYDPNDALHTNVRAMMMLNRAVVSVTYQYANGYVAVNLCNPWYKPSSPESWATVILYVERRK